MHRLIPIAALALLAGCATTSAITTSALVDTDKALIVADAAYHAAEQTALVTVPGMSPATKATVGALNDKASSALHTAYVARTSTAVALAVDAIAAFSAAAKGGQ